MNYKSYSTLDTLRLSANLLHWYGHQFIVDSGHKSFGTIYFRISNEGAGVNRLRVEETVNFVHEDIASSFVILWWSDSEWLTSIRGFLLAISAMSSLRRPILSCLSPNHIACPIILTFQ